MKRFTSPFPVSLLPALAACVSLSTMSAFADPPLVNAPAPAVPAAVKQPVSHAPQIDTSAMALLKKSEEAMLHLKSYRAECLTTRTAEPDDRGNREKPRCTRSTLVAEKPNLLCYESWRVASDTRVSLSSIPDTKSVCDGKTQWDKSGKRYRFERFTDLDSLSYDENREPWVGFFSAGIDTPYGMNTYDQQQGDLVELRFQGKGMVAGVPCDIVVAHSMAAYKGKTYDTRTTWYIGPDALLRRQIDRASIDSKPASICDTVVRNVVVNVPVADRARVFSFPAPKGVKFKAPEVEVPESRTILVASTPEPLPASKAPAAAPLSPLVVGDTAPDFSGVDSEGKSVKLSDLRGKVVVLDFWASWCGPCKASMPHNQEVIAKLQAAPVPVVLLAVDDNEDRPAFAAWVKMHPQYDALRFAFVDSKQTDVSGTLYRTFSIPSQFVIDANGVIRATFVGYSHPTDRLEKAVLAATSFTAGK